MLVHTMYLMISGARRHWAVSYSAYSATHLTLLTTPEALERRKQYSHWRLQSELDLFAGWKMIKQLPKLDMPQVNRHFDRADLRLSRQVRVRNWYQPIKVPETARCK